MRFSVRQDTGLPADVLFSAVSDFGRIERMLVRRGAEIRRLDPAQEPGAGMSWDAAFDLRGKRREMRLTVARLDSPEKVVVNGLSDSLELTIEMTVIALTRAKSRLILELGVRPRHMRARLMLQTAKLGKAQMDRQFADRVSRFVADLLAHRN